MLQELVSRNKVIGVKQSRKAIREGCAACVYLACDADPLITDPLAASCEELGIPVNRDCSMAQLGRACRITVGASAVVLLKQN